MQTFFFCSLIITIIIIVIVNNDAPCPFEFLEKLRTRVTEIWKNFFPRLFLCIAVRIVSAFCG